MSFNLQATFYEILKSCPRIQSHIFEPQAQNHFHKTGTFTKHARILPRQLLILNHYSIWENNFLSYKMS